LRLRAGSALGHWWRFVSAGGHSSRKPLQYRFEIKGPSGWGKPDGPCVQSGEAARPVRLEGAGRPSPTFFLPLIGGTFPLK